MVFMWTNAQQKSSSAGFLTFEQIPESREATQLKRNTLKLNLLGAKQKCTTRRKLLYALIVFLKVHQSTVNNAKLNKN